MRKRSLSVAYERTPRVEQISKKFEGVPSDREEESESEEENEEMEVDAASDWTAADYKKLIEQLQSAVPRKDKKTYKATLKKIDWDRVAFDGHTAEETKAVTNDLFNKIRKFRTFSEMVNDIPAKVDKMLSTGKPKNPLSAFNFFVKDKFHSYRKKNAELPAHEIMKIVCREYASLSDKKKNKYEAMAAEAKEAHKLQMAQYYEDHPEALQPNKSKKGANPTKGSTKNKIRKPKTITPFALFSLEKRAEVGPIAIAELRNLWNDLELKKKVKYVQQAFQSQTEHTEQSLKLTKQEQQLLEQARGKPGMFPGSTSEYYLKHHATPDSSLPLNVWRKEKLLEYKKLSKVRKLELEIEYRHAKQEYVNKYEAYIEQIKDENERHAEIELLTSFIQTKMDKHDREQCDTRPLQSFMELTRVDNIFQFPIAESTIISTSKKSKRKVVEDTSKPEPVNPPIAASPKSKPLKSILKSSASPVTVIPKNNVQEFIVPDAVNASKNKRKRSLSGQDSDSSSDKKSNISIVSLQNSSETRQKKAGSKANGTSMELGNEPMRPPLTILEFYKQNHYLGKPENCAESFKALSKIRKESLKAEMRAAHKKYFKQLQKLLKTKPQEKIQQYLKKLKEAEKACQNTSQTSENETGEEEDSDVKQITKQEPETSSSNSSNDSSSEDE